MVLFRALASLPDYLLEPTALTLRRLETGLEAGISRPTLTEL